MTDHFRSRLEFGPEKQLRALIDAAHAFGLRVIMDFVPNHFSTEHRYYVDNVRNQTVSPYLAWFERDAEGEPTHYFDWEHLKNLPLAARSHGGCHDDRSALVLLNYSREAIDVRLPTSPAITSITGANKLQDALTAEPVTAIGHRIRLAPFDARVLASADAPCANVMSAR